MIGVDNTKKLYFMDESNLNQLSLQDNTVVGPSGFEIFQEDYRTFITESLTLIMLVDHEYNVVHQHLYHNKVNGSTTSNRIIEFLCEAEEKIHSAGPYPLFLDNAPTHTCAFKRSSDLANWKPLWAAPSTQRQTW